MEGHYDLGNAELAQRYPEAKIIVSGGNYRRVYVPYCYAHLTFVYARQFFLTVTTIRFPMARTLALIELVRSSPAMARTCLAHMLSRRGAVRVREGGRQF
jgi:hypothetical protein